MTTRMVFIDELPEPLRKGVRQVQADHPELEGDVLPLDRVLRLVSLYYGPPLRVELEHYALMIKSVVDAAATEPHWDEGSLLQVMRVHGTDFQRKLADAWLCASEMDRLPLRNAFNELLGMYRPYAIAEKNRPGHRR